MKIGCCVVCEYPLIPRVKFSHRSVGHTHRQALADFLRAFISFAHRLLMFLSFSRYLSLALVLYLSLPFSLSRSLAFSLFRFSTDSLLCSPFVLVYVDLSLSVDSAPSCEYSVNVDVRSCERNFFLWGCSGVYARPVYAGELYRRVVW